MAHITAWANFYLIVGSASATLTALMFVVITLTAGRREVTSDTPFGAFATPTIVHFGGALLVAAILSAPWQEPWQPGVVLCLSGLGGIAYTAVVVRRTRRQTSYTPVLEDWLWHVHFPLVAYIALTIAALVLVGNSMPALFVVGASTLLLLFIGIHNAWDNAVYNAIALSPPKDQG